MPTLSAIVRPIFLTSPPWATAIALCTALVLPSALAAPAAGGFAYVSNQKGEVSVVALTSLSIQGSLSAYGNEPRGIGVTDDGRWIVIANREGGRIAVVDRATGKLVRHIPIGQNPEFVRTRGHLAFVSFEPASTGLPPPRPGAPTHAAETKAASMVADKKENNSVDADAPVPARVAVVDLDAGVVLREIVGGLETEGIEFTADGQHILVTNEADNTVTVHDVATGQRVKTIDTHAYGDRPRGVKRSPDGLSIIVTLEFANTFLVLDPQFQVVRAVKTGESPYRVSFDRSGQRLFVAAARSKQLQVFDARTYALLKNIPIGERCWHFSFTPDERQILVACGRSNEIVVIDAMTLEPVKRIPDAAMPWGIVTYPKSMGSLDQPG